ncbi:cyclophilin-like fold protein [Thermodesulfitimonas autotrophica]|uniref:cyclophilin-like fold protein n=1 Tax=Thermodesulfitimonas autotrophica TaxID=1894989 RepID=UPI002FE20E46
MLNAAKRIVQIEAGAVTLQAVLNDSQTACAVWEALPITGKANRWGDEIYFFVPLTLPEENPQELVAVGDIAYWPEGPALCLFFGPTPVSRGSEVRPASPVNVCGRIMGDATVLKTVRDGTPIKIRRPEGK